MSAAACILAWSDRQESIVQNASAKSIKSVTESARRPGLHFKPRKAFCAYCGKPMLKKVASQKYHNGCAKKAYNAKANLNAKATYKIKQQEKKKPEKTFPSIGEVQALADKLGKHYGEVSQMLATGELTYER